MDQLSYFRLFHNITDEEFQFLSEHLRKRSFNKGDFVTIPGQVQKELFFVIKGVQMSYFEGDNKVHVIAFTYSPNLCAIPESFSFQKPSQYFLKCLTDSEFLAISFEKLHEVFERSQNIERLFRRMTEAILAGMINRHVELQAFTMEERYRAFCHRSPHLLQLVPHKYLASYLGIDSTNFSKLYNSIRI
jgi:CRP-like cAMP-binding protein